MPPSSALFPRPSSRRLFTKVPHYADSFLQITRTMNTYFYKSYVLFDVKSPAFLEDTLFIGFLQKLRPFIKAKPESSAFYIKYVLFHRY